MARLFRTLENDSVICTACRRYCRLRPGQTGFCGVRKNEGGSLDLMVHSIPMAINIDPIEKKPVLHAYPGSRVLSFGTAGCNFACRFCQNYEMSQRRRVTGTRATPEDIVQAAVANGCRGIAYTYNEPTIFMEFAEDVGKLAHEHGLFNVFVTNGYETPEAVESMKHFLDFATVDFKGNAAVEFYRKYISIGDPDSIFDTLLLLRDTDIHLEITDLVIPGIGDDLGEAERMLGRIIEIFGYDIPVSFLRFHPDYLLRDIERTPVDTLRAHHSLARSLGLRYVYIGNVPGLDEQNTYCPECHELLIRRDFLETTDFRLSRNSTCPSCGLRIPFIL